MVHVNIKTQKYSYKEIHQKKGPFQLLFRCSSAPAFKEKKALQPSKGESWHDLTSSSYLTPLLVVYQNSWYSLYICLHPILLWNRAVFPYFQRTVWVGKDLKHNGQHLLDQTAQSTIQTGLEHFRAFSFQARERNRDCLWLRSVAEGTSENPCSHKAQSVITFQNSGKYTQTWLVLSRDVKSIHENTVVRVIKLSCTCLFADFSSFSPVTHKAFKALAFRILLSAWQKVITLHLTFLVVSKISWCIFNCY